MDKAWGDVRLQSGPSLTEYTYTGQYSYTGSFGLMYYNARWYDPALGRFAQADSIVPPGVQGLDRYAYVNNSPMNYVDPSGHICVESDGDSDVGMAGNCHGGSNPKYKPGLQGPKWNPKWENKNVEESEGGENMPQTDASPGCSQNDYDCLLKLGIDGEFDPYNAYIPSNGSNTDLAIFYNNLAYEAYAKTGYDLEMIAKFGINNPMTVYDFANAGIPIEWIEMTSPNRRTPAQAFFIQVMRLDNSSVTNYEPNYLHAMMEVHPIELEMAKQNYYDALIAVAGDARTAYELWILRDELMGDGVIEP